MGYTHTHSLYLYHTKRPSLVEVVQKVEVEVDRISVRTCDIVDVSYGPPQIQWLTLHSTFPCSFSWVQSVFGETSLNFSHFSLSAFSKWITFNCSEIFYSNYHYYFGLGTSAEIKEPILHFTRVPKFNRILPTLGHGVWPPIWCPTRRDKTPDPP